MSEKTREAFDAWGKEQARSAERVRVDIGDLRSVKAAMEQIAWEAWLSSRRQALEEAAAIAESKVDPEWPGDDLSVQAASIASAIRREADPK